MEAVHVATLRGICARYIEGHLGPVLQELLRSQQQIETQLEALSQAAVRKTEHREAEERLADLLTKCNTDLAEITAKVERLESGGGHTDNAIAAGSFEELSEALRQELTQKADLNDVPTMEQFRDLAADVERKANFNQVVSSSQLQRISDKVDRKANTNRVPTMTQFQELSTVVEGKANIVSVPTVSQFDEFCGTVERKITACSLVNPAQIQKIAAALERKADLDQVPTRARVDELCISIEKVVASEVPTLAQFKALAIRVDRTEQEVKQEMKHRASIASCAGAVASTPAQSNSATAVGSNGGMPTNGGMHCGGAANVVWLVPAAMEPSQWESGYGQQQQLGCSGMWTPQSADCHQQWRPSNGINETQ